MFESNSNSRSEFQISKINPEFYSRLFDNASKEFESSSEKLNNSHDSIETIISDILTNRTSSGLSISNIAILLNSIRKFKNQKIRKLIISEARKLRQSLYSNLVATMVPIEVSSYCTSNCSFCGWRSDNSEMIRLKISEKALIEQVEYLSKLGFSHFEIATGDDLVFLKNNLSHFIHTVKNTAKKYIKSPRVSICVTPLQYEHYLDQKKLDLDTVLTWQETYNSKTFYKYVNNGPKAKGITSSFKIDQSGDGHLQRMQSQENAIRANLQVGLGVMIGLDENVESDILAVIIHGKKLIETYQEIIQPLIIGMPTWNPITTSNDNLDISRRPIDLEENFELIAAIYLLSFPDYLAWVFPNCRVSLKTQLESVKTAGIFTSTMVRVGPGAYLANSSSNFSDYFDKTSIPNSNLNSDLILKGEQFVHHFHSHKEYADQFEDAGLRIISDSEVLNLGNLK